MKAKIMENENVAAKIEAAKEDAELLYGERLKLVAPYSQFKSKIELKVYLSENDFQIILNDLVEQQKLYDIQQEKIRIESKNYGK